MQRFSGGLQQQAAKHGYQIHRKAPTSSLIQKGFEEHEVSEPTGIVGEVKEKVGSKVGLED